MKWLQTIKADEAEYVQKLIKSGIFLSPQEYIRKLIIQDKKIYERKANKIKNKQKKKI